ncbi:hypothetical protein ABBQ38_010797 [Trebouxia sp. C0009 RCD-2024]
MHIHVFCITFGVPLIGDALLQDCIHGQFGWGKDFLHIVARHDIVPRILLSKFAGAGSLVKWLGSRLFAIRHETQETRIAIDSQEHDNINLALENVEKEKEALLQEGSARSQPLQTIPSRQERQLGEQPVPAATRPGNGHSSRPSETEYRTALPADLSELIETEVKSKKLFRKGQFVYRYHTALYSGFVMVTILALISFFSLMIQPIINSKSSCSSLFDKLVLVVYLLDYLTSPLGWIGGCKRKQQPVRRYHTQKHSVQSMRQDPQKLKDDTWADFMHQLRFAMCFSWVASCVAMWHQHSFNSIAQLMHCTVLLAFLKEFAVWSLLSG